jgi:XTP/dITP diphosphohydrolase
MNDMTSITEMQFASSNAHKLKEANLSLARYGISLKMARVEKVEIQADSLEAIASYAAHLAAESSCAAVVCEDSGLFIDALGGFPGPYSSYAFKTLGCKGILKLMECLSDRKGRFQSAVSFCELGSSPTTFIGTAEGSISEEPRGSEGFGFDPIFIPTGGDGRTFAQMDIAEKGRLSHRGEAFRRFAAWASGMAKLK